ncbi:MAG TPA: glycosyltransferase family 39 protein [Myxococcota bacterium]|nr:glycosyltransferase family 39 protein [Myxococcota bacterium]HRY95926.1 glycosyltransferase family 39 protein [Myxococcota bacterium]HSA24003.1 glycosyltransferase family 39 protein [Myxococcota bacterium]
MVASPLAASAGGSRLLARPWLPALIVVGLALAVRLVILWQSQASPTFAAPIIDSARYDHLARALAAGEDPGAELYWQPPAYPLLLAGLYASSGGSILLAKLVQALAGACTALLAWRLGRRLVGAAGGWLAGLCVALYGPLVYFEGELLAEGWAALLAPALVLALLHVAERGGKLAGLGAGLLLGLCWLTRPTFAPVCLAGLAWLAWRRWRLTPRLAALAPVGLAALALGVTLGALGLASAHALGRPALLPLSGGLNLHLGNQPELCRGLTLRPGAGWDELVHEAEAAGAGQDPFAQQAHFAGRAWGFAAADPLGFARGLGAKALRLVSGRELPRNTDVYTAAGYAPLLRVLVWKAGGFGFPFGLLLPLAALGLVFFRPSFPGPVWLLLGLWSASLVWVLVADRYRVVLVPVLAAPAAAGALLLVERARRRRWRELLAPVALLLGVGALAWAPGPFCEEQGPFEAELHLGAGAYHQSHGRPREALAAYRRALALQPGFREARANLAGLDSQLGRLALQRRDPAAAEAHLAEAVDLGQADPATLNDLAWLLAGGEGKRSSPVDCARAVELGERAVALTSRQDPAMLDTLSLALLCGGERARAAQVAREALALAEQRGLTELVHSLRARLEPGP